MCIYSAGFDKRFHVNVHNKMANLGFGGASLTSMGSYKEVRRLLLSAINEGITHFDTAPLYGQGYSEVIFGKVFKSLRERITITSKFGFGDGSMVNSNSIPVEILLPLNYHYKKFRKLHSGNSAGQQFNISGMNLRMIGKKEIQDSIHNSLKKLQTDFIDYYLLHESLPQYLSDEAMQFILSLKSSGQVRYLGIGSGINKIASMKGNVSTDWDILQYENVSDIETQNLMSRFPGMLHFHHSCLKHIGEKSDMENVPEHEKAGMMLARSVANNPRGKVIFSTRNPGRLKENISAYLKYAGMN